MPLFGIVKAFWMQKQALGLRILIKTPNPLSRRYRRTLGPHAHHLVFIIQTLVNDIDLALCKAKNRILDIHLGDSLQGNKVYWKGSTCQTCIGAQEFVTFLKVHNSGLLLHHMDHREDLYLFGRPLPRRIRQPHECTPTLDEYIWRSIMISKDPVVFDFENNSHTGSGFEALQKIGHLRERDPRPIRETWYLRYWEGNYFQVQMLADELYSQSRPFEQLRLWLCVERSEEYPWACRRCEWRGGLSFILRAKVSHHSERVNIRVGIMEIIRTTSHVQSVNVDTRVAVACRDQGEDCEQLGPSISLDLFRQRAFQALTQISWQERKCEPLLQPCPDLLINGLGEVVEAAWSSENATLDYSDRPQPGTYDFDKLYVLSYDDERSPYRTIEVPTVLGEDEIAPKPTKNKESYSITMAL